MTPESTTTQANRPKRRRGRQDASSSNPKNRPRSSDESLFIKTNGNSGGSGGGGVGKHQTLLIRYDEKSTKPLQNKKKKKQSSNGMDDNEDDDDGREGRWFDMGSTHADRDAVLTPEDVRRNQVLVERYRQMADSIYRREVQLYSANGKSNNNSSSKNGASDNAGDAGDANSSNGISNAKSKDDLWVEATMRQGTLKDRIAAMSVVVSTAPVHKLYALDGLLHMITGCHVGDNHNKNNTSNTSNSSSSSSVNARVAQLAAEAVLDLFLHTFLPPHRKLLTLAQRPLIRYEQQQQQQQAAAVAAADENATSQQGKKKRKGTPTTTPASGTPPQLSPRVLLLWRFEEMVKERYDLFLRHYVAFTLQKESVAVSSTSKSSRGKSSTSTNAAATTSTTTPDVHKVAALRTAATLLQRVPEGEALLLAWIVNKLGDPNPKLCAQAAHELRRTLQFHPGMPIAREVQQLAHRPHLSHVALYNCVTFLNQLKLTRSNTSNNNSHTTTDEPSLAVSLIRTYFHLFEVAIHRGATLASTNSKNPPVDSKHPVAASASATATVSQSRLVSALLQGVNRAHPYLPIADQNMDEHVDALYRVVHTSPPGARTQSLLLLFHVTIGSPQNDNDGDDMHSSKKKKNHNNKNLVDKQLLRSRQDRFYRALYSTLSDPAMLGAGKHLTMYFNLLYKAIKYDTIVSRVNAFAKRILSVALHCSSPVLAASIFLLNEIGKDRHPLLLECYMDVLYGADALRVLDPSKREPCGALVSSTDVIGTVESINDSENTPDTNDKKRAPAWEVSLAKHHFHPTVRKFASTIGDANSSYSGDPLKDFALAPFLDKFAYRNPKSVERVAGRFRRGESVGERRSGTDSMIQSQFALPVNDPSFWSKSATVGEHDEFFQTFFQERSRRDAVKGIVRHKSAPNEDDDNDDYKRQLEALEREEERDVDQYANFEELESKWESDDEEEAFVDSLAQQIIDDAMEGNIHELDDEDPDMDDWDDMYTEQTNSEGRAEEENEADSDVEEEENDDDDDGVETNDDDAFMDLDNDSDSRDDDNDGADDFDDEIDVEQAFFSANADEDDDDDEDDDVRAGDADGIDNVVAADFDDDDNAADDDANDDDDHRGDFMFLDDDESDEDETPQLVQLSVGAGGKSESTFADAEDYAELISKSWTDQKRSAMRQHHDNEKSAKETNETLAKSSARGMKKKKSKAI